MAVIYLKRHLSASISERISTTHFPTVIFSSSGKNGEPVDCNYFPGSLAMCLLVNKVNAWVLFAKPLFRRCLLYKTPTCKASLSIGFGVCVPPAAFSSEIKELLRMVCGDFRSL